MGGTEIEGRRKGMRKIGKGQKYLIQKRDSFILAYVGMCECIKI